MRILAAHQDRMVPIVHPHFGMIDKSLGDGVLVTSGLGTPNDRYAAEAIECAEAVLADLALWSVLPEMQVIQRPLAIGLAQSA